MKTLLATLAAIGALALSVTAVDLSDIDKQFLAGYAKIQVALAADDLASAKSAANEMGADGAELARATSLKEARSAFEKLSSRAATLAKDRPGYYVVNCPMLKKDWVQTTDKIANPYAGKEMPTCGVIKK